MSDNVKVSNPQLSTSTRAPRPSRRGLVIRNQQRRAHARPCHIRKHTYNFLMLSELKLVHPLQWFWRKPIVVDRGGPRSLDRGPLFDFPDSHSSIFPGAKDFCGLTR